MYARNVTMRLKPNAAEEFTRTLEEHIIPLLRKHRGFADEIAFLGPDRTEAVAISLWDDRGSADAYDRTSYPQVLGVLATVLEGLPVVSAYNVSTSTFHPIRAVRDGVWIDSADQVAARVGGQPSDRTARHMIYRAARRMVYRDRLSSRIQGGKVGWSGGRT